jgi:hypothetical protein
VESGGPGLGATFTVHLPATRLAGLGSDTAQLPVTVVVHAGSSGTATVRSAAG